MSDACPFCDIVAGRLPASLVWEDAVAVAFLDLRQAVPGHVLVVPRAHYPDIHALDEDVAAHLMRLAVRIARALGDSFAAEGLSLWQSNGPAAMQEVPHVHLHVHPRRIGDGLLRVYPENRPPADAVPEALDPLAAEIGERIARQVPASADSGA